MSHIFCCTTQAALVAGPWLRFGLRDSKWSQRWGRTFALLCTFRGQCCPACAVRVIVPAHCVVVSLRVSEGFVQDCTVAENFCRAANSCQFPLRFASKYISMFCKRGGCGYGVQYSDSRLPLLTQTPGHDSLVPLAQTTHIITRCIIYTISEHVCATCNVCLYALALTWGSDCITFLKLARVSRYCACRTYDLDVPLSVQCYLLVSALFWHSVWCCMLLIGLWFINIAPFISR